MWRRNTPPATLADLGWRGDPKSPCIWVALLRSQFEDPSGAAPSYQSPHYVLVLDVTGEEVVVIDPHPWRETIRKMSKGDFDAAWTAVRGPGKPRWAGCLYRSSE